MCPDLDEPPEIGPDFAQFQGAKEVHMLTQLIIEVLNLYNDIDKEINEFLINTSIQCLDRCGQCCLSPNVEATIVEFFPLAAELTRRGELLNWFQLLEDRKGDNICALYDPNPSPSQKGHCRFYVWRPVLCRLFGVSFTRDKNNKPVLLVCHQQKSSYPELVKKTQQLLNDGLFGPNLQHFFLHIQGLGPNYIHTLMPINQALYQALAHFRFYLDYILNILESEILERLIQTSKLYSLSKILQK